MSLKTKWNNNLCTHTQYTQFTTKILYTYENTFTQYFKLQSCCCCSSFLGETHACGFGYTNIHTNTHKHWDTPNTQPSLHNHINTHSRQLIGNITNINKCRTIFCFLFYYIELHLSQSIPNELSCWMVLLFIFFSFERMQFQKLKRGRFVKICGLFFIDYWQLYHRLI